MIKGKFLPYKEWLAKHYPYCDNLLGLGGQIKVESDRCDSCLGYGDVLDIKELEKGNVEFILCDSCGGFGSKKLYKEYQEHLQKEQKLLTDYNLAMLKKTNPQNRIRIGIKPNDYRS